MTKLINNLENIISDAVAHYWQSRRSQREKQKKRGISDAGLRSAVTGGAQMDGFIRLFTDIIVDAGMEERYVFRKKLLQLPGFFRTSDSQTGLEGDYKEPANDLSFSIFLKSLISYIGAFI